MKRIVSWMIVLMIFAGMYAFADDTGIQLIGGPESEAEVVNLEDFKVGETAKIDGFGEVTFSAAEWCGKINKYDRETVFLDMLGKWNYLKFYESGTEASYLRLQFDILNIQKEPVDFYEKINDVICVYDEDYMFGGWTRQHVIIRDEGEELVTLNSTTTGSPIETFYRGQYSVVITLPNDVYQRVTDKKNPKPLSVTFMLGDNEVTYVYREN